MHSLQPSRGPDSRMLRRWAQLWALVLIAPAALAVSSMSVTMAAASILLCFGLPSVTALAITAENVRALRVRLPGAVGFGAGSAVTCLGFGGLFLFSGYLVWVALAAYATTAAWAHFSPGTPPAQAVEAPDESQEEVATEPPVAVATPDEVGSMTNAELCHAWRRSFVTLESTRSPGRRAEVVSLRQVLLDELEVRHPDGLRAWLLSGARAASGPDQFLGRPHVE